MSGRVKKLHPALKHGAYSATDLLPGEDRAAFEKLRRDLISELRPEGPLESDIVETIARIMWRKQNLVTIHIAKLVRNRYSAIRSKIAPSPPPLFPLLELGTDPNWEPPDPGELEAAEKAAVAQTQEELGDSYVFAEMGEAITPDQMFKDFEVEERFNVMLEKHIKRLLHLRGLKSFPSAAASAPLPRIPGPQKAA
jgi:hypothetical protein